MSLHPEIKGIYCDFKDGGTEPALHNRIINNMSDKLEVTINGDNIEIKDDTYQYVSIRIDEWEKIKDAVDAKLYGKYHHLRKTIKNTDPIKID